MPPKPEDVLRKLRRIGFEEESGKGSHRIVIHLDGRRTVIPFHRKELKKGTYHKILKDVGLSEEEYRKLRHNPLVQVLQAGGGHLFGQGVLADAAGGGDL